MKPFRIVARPIANAALLLGTLILLRTATIPASDAGTMGEPTAGMQGGEYLRPWMLQALPYSPAHDRLLPYHGYLMHDRDHDLVLDWSDGTTDRSNDLLRFTFHGHWVDVDLGEAWSAAHRADQQDPQEPCASPTVMAEDVLAHDEVPYPERVLAHLRAQLRIGAAKADLLGAQHPTPEGDDPADAPNDHELPDEPQNIDRP